MFSDLECDYINPIDLCNKLNQVRHPLTSLPGPYDGSPIKLLPHLFPPLLTFLLSTNPPPGLTLTVHLAGNGSARRAYGLLPS